MSIAKAKWFEYTDYMNNKLAQMQASDPSYTMDRLVNAFGKAGFAGEEGAYKHFQKYGHTEDVSPNSLFDADYYYQSKALQYYQKQGMSADDIKANMSLYAANMKAAIHKAGMDAWTHYIKYGTSEGVNPSADFNTAEYMQAKFAAWSATKPGATINDMYTAFKKAGLNALEHAEQYGTDPTTAKAGEAQCWTDTTHTTLADAYNHNDDDLGGGQTGQTFKLTTAIDVVTGTKGSDTIIGDNSNNFTVQAGDQIDGGAGTDTFDYYGAAANVLLPQLSNVEIMNLHAPAADSTLDIHSNSSLEKVVYSNFTGAIAPQVAGATLSASQTLGFDKSTVGTVAETINNGATANLSLANGSSIGTVTITSTGLKVVNIESTGSAANTINGIANTNATTLTFTGDQSVTLTTAPTANYTTVDGSAMTDGGFTVNLTNAANHIVKGGAGDDKVNFGATLTAQDKVDLGAGTDVVEVTAATTASVLNHVSNVEYFAFGATQTINASALASTVEGLIVKSGAFTLTVQDAKANHTYVAETDATAITELDVTAASGVTSLSFKLDNQRTTDSTLTDLDVHGVQTVSIESTGKGGNIIDTLTLATDNSSVTITGDKDLTINNPVASTTTGHVFNASSFTGKLNIVGGNGNDTFVGGSGNDTFEGGAKVDTYTGGSGADKFILDNVTTGSIDKITDFTVSDGDKISATGGTFVDKVAAVVDKGAVVGADAQTAAGNLGALVAHTAYTFTNNNHTYLLINDNDTAYTAANDTIVDITGIDGTLTVDCVYYD